MARERPCRKSHQSTPA